MKLEREDPQPLQRQITEVVHFLGDGVRPTDGLVKDGKMRQAGDTAAADHIRPTFVTALTKPFYLTEQVLGKVLERCQGTIARLPPESEFGVWSQQIRF